MTEPAAPTDVGATVRALRRRADLSQRELAKRSGVPAGTIARIESGNAHDPRFRTVERLVTAAGGAIRVGRAKDQEPPLPAIPHAGLRDGAGRRYSAHLDVRRVVTGRDWWGAWWAHWYEIPQGQWPRKPPNHTYDLNRGRRDRRRRKLAGAARAAQLRVTRVAADDLPEQVWLWTATDPPTGDVVGWLGGYVRRRRVDGDRELVVCDVEVDPAWRQCGVGRRLIAGLRAELRRSGVRRARVLIDEHGLPYEFFHACGFILGPGSQPSWLMLPAGRA